VTTGVDVLGLVIANNICASLDVAGAAFKVVACDNNAGGIQVTAWPTAANEELFVRVMHQANRAEMGVYDLRGELIMPIRAIGNGETITRLDLGGLPTGSYMVRVMSGDEVISQRFMRVD